MDGWMEGERGAMDGWLDEGMYGWMEGEMDGWSKGWLDGGIDGEKEHTIQTSCPGAALMLL